MPFSRRARSWAPPADTSIERLAFLAAEEHLRSRSNSGWSKVVRVLEGGSGGSRGTAFKVGAGASNSLAGQMRSERMGDYVIACDEAAQQLNVEERASLRAAGALPPWFWPAVEDSVKRQQRDRRGGGFR